MKQASFCSISLAIAAAFLVAWPAFAQTTAFTFQGRLTDGAAPADGSYDLKFTLYDAAGPGGTTIGGPVTNAASVVSAGLFTATLDFGSAGFTGEDRWLEIAVRTNGGGAFLTLSPRQRLTSTPYAITAAQVTGVVPASGLAGSYSNAVNFSNPLDVFAGSFAGNGGALSNVNAATLGGLLASSFWKLTGNNVGPGQFLGSTNEQALELRVNGYRALRLEPNPNNAPNVIGGSLLNQADAGVIGATVGGGGGYTLPNRISANFGTIGGGINNAIPTHGIGAVIAGGNSNTNDSPGAFIGGGGYNRIEVSSNNYPAVIAGGTGNTIQADNENSAIVAGIENTLENAAAWSFLGGGGYNSIKAGALASSIVGGVRNTNGSTYSLIGGGSQNYIQPQSDYSFLAGGLNNTIESTAAMSSIGGGWLNYIQGGADQSVIAGGNAGHILSGARESFVGGGFANTIETNAFGAVIVGGAFSTNSSAEAFIGGGFGNRIGTNSPYAAIGAGSANSVLTHAEGAVIGGGNGNVVVAPFGTVSGGQQNTSSWTYATIGGGYQNFASGNFSGSGDSATVAGGWGNAALGNNAVVGGGVENYASGDNAAIAGGALNTNQTGYGFIGGGNQNLIEPFSRFSMIGGGDHHVIHSNSLYAVIAGGQSNVIGPNATFGVILGGLANEVTSTNALAAGRRAKAVHQGSFVWADSTDADFFSTANDQFNIRAAGGLRLETAGGSATLNSQPILSGTIATSQLQDNSVTAQKIAPGQVVKSLNGLRDDVTLTPGANVAITPAGNGLQISANYTAGNGLQLVGNQFSLRPGSTLTNDNVKPWAFKAIAPSGVWTGPVGLYGQGGNSTGIGFNVKAGVLGESGEEAGVFGASTGTDALSAGVLGSGYNNTPGVAGLAESGNGVQGTSSGANGVQGSSTSTTASGVYGENLSGSGYGIAGRARTNGAAVYGDNLDSAGWAGYFNGRVNANGNLIANADLAFTDSTRGIRFPPTAGANAPMITMFASGTGNADRMVIAHSLAFANYGLQYQDTSDRFNFLANGLNVMTIDLSTRNVGLGVAAPTFQLQLSADSAAKPNGGSWANSSDARVKKNIEPMTDGLDKLTRLRGVTFEWRNPEDHANQTGRQAGFLAQEVEQVFPNWVSEVPGAEHDKALTDNGKVKSLVLPFEFDALVVEAFRQLRAEKDAQIATLEKTTRDLKEELAAQKTALKQMQAQLSLLTASPSAIAERPPVRTAVYHAATSQE